MESKEKETAKTDEKAWYFLDPDNNKDDPASGLFCARCKKSIKSTQAFESFFPIIIHPVHPWFRIAGAFEKSHGLIGSHCFDKVKDQIMNKTDIAC